MIVAVSGCSDYGLVTPGTISSPQPPVISEPLAPTPPPAVVEPEPGTAAAGDEDDVMHPDLGRPLFPTPDIIMRCGPFNMSGQIFEDRLEFAIDGGDYVLPRIDAEDGTMWSDGTYSLEFRHGMGVHGS